MHNPLPPVLPVLRGGTGVSSFVAGQLLFGAGTGPLQSSSLLAWDDANKKLTLSAATLQESGSSLFTIRSAGDLDLFAASASSGSNASSVLLQGGSGTAGNVSGGNVSNQAGNGFGAGSGGAVDLTGGNSGATAGTTGGAAQVQGGAGKGGGGIASLVSGATQTSGPGVEVDILAADGVGSNMSGGNVVIFAGSKTGSGTPGYVYISNAGANYGLATGTGTVTRGNNAPGVVALSVKIWIPLLIDGTLTYLEGYQP